MFGTGMAGSKDRKALRKSGQYGGGLGPGANHDFVLRERALPVRNINHQGGVRFQPGTVNIAYYPDHLGVVHAAAGPADALAERVLAGPKLGGEPAGDGGHIAPAIGGFDRPAVQ